MVSQEVIAEAEKMKQAAAGVRAAAEKVRTGDHDGAIASLRPILEKSPKDSNALYVLGMAHMKKAQWAEAEAAFVQVREIVPGFAAVHKPDGTIEIDKTAFEKALGYLERAKAGYAAQPDKVKFIDDLIALVKEQIKK